MVLENITNFSDFNNLLVILGAGILGVVTLGVVKVGKKNMKIVQGIAAVAVGVGLLGLAPADMLSGGGGSSSAAPGLGGAVLSPAASLNCPTDGDSSVVINVRNGLNTSGSETYDNTVICNGESGHSVSFTDTTSPSSQVFNCGEQYTCKITGVTGANGDNSYVYGFDLPGQSELQSSLSGSSADAQISDGNVVFRPKASSATLNFVTHQNGVFNCRAFDIVNDGFLFDDQDTSANDYETDGVTFNSTTDGDSDGTTVGAGGEYNVRMECRPGNADEDLNDRGIYVLVDAVSSEFNKDLTRVSYSTKGASWTTLSEATGLPSSEDIAYNGYEFVGLIPGSTTYTHGAELWVDVYLKADSGNNPSTDPQVDFEQVNQYTSATGTNVVKAGARQDDSSQTVVMVTEDFAFTIN